MTVTINTSLQNFQVDNWGAELDGGAIDIYTGSQPVDPNDAPTGLLLVSCSLDATNAYEDAVDGEAEKSGVIAGVAVDSGTAGYAVQRNASNGRWMYGSVTATGFGGDVELDATSITSGQLVTITASVISQVASE